ncbi:MAG: hypothetical protein IJA20_03680 [Methanocorpusculum sp.]|nr:hypothetical protein [Oscillospiraceae bacterium]MBQ3569758.1 hypothetical protein [Methanocorpusculum sp.]
MKPKYILPFLCLLLLLCSGCQKVPDGNGEIIIGKAGAPVSSAAIHKVGFVSGIPAGEHTAPSWTEDFAAPGTIFSCCEVVDLGEVSTSLQVYWTLPDGSTTQPTTLAVNQNMYFYAELDIIDSGAYTVHWSLYGKEESTATVLTS